MARGPVRFDHTLVLHYKLNFVVTGREYMSAIPGIRIVQERN